VPALANSINVYVICANEALILTRLHLLFLPKTGTIDVEVTFAFFYFVIFYDLLVFHRNHQLLVLLLVYHTFGGFLLVFLMFLLKLFLSLFHLPFFLGFVNIASALRGLG
jgi:hypothetical protein